MINLVYIGSDIGDITVNAFNAITESDIILNFDNIDLSILDEYTKDKEIISNVIEDDEEGLVLPAAEEDGKAEDHIQQVAQHQHLHLVVLLHDLGGKEGCHHAGSCGEEAQQHIEVGAAEEIEGSKQTHCRGGLQHIHGAVAAVVDAQVLVVFQVVPHLAEGEALLPIFRMVVALLAVPAQGHRFYLLRNHSYFNLPTLTGSFAAAAQLKIVNHDKFDVVLLSFKFFVTSCINFTVILLKFFKKVSHFSIPL